jgi:hypothetical protein
MKVVQSQNAGETSEATEQEREDEDDLLSHHHGQIDDFWEWKDKNYNVLSDPKAGVAEGYDIEIKTFCGNTSIEGAT